MRIIVATFLCLALTSCARRPGNGDAPQPENSPLPLPPRNAPPPSPLSRLDPVPPQPSSVLINAGQIPLVQLFDQGGRVRILNATTKQTLLTTDVPAHSIIAVTDSGILVARQRRLTTRLDPNHRFELWWDNAGSSAARPGSP